MGDTEFGYDEAAAEVDRHGVIPFFDADVEDVGYAFAVAGVDDYDVGSLVVVLGDFFYEAVEVGFLGYVALVRRDSP